MDFLDGNKIENFEIPRKEEFQLFFVSQALQVHKFPELENLASVLIALMQLIKIHLIIESQIFYGR